MGDFAKIFGASTALVLIVVLLLVIGPVLLLWSANTISEQASLGWYIPHNIWTYISAILLMCLLRGGK